MSDDWVTHTKTGRTGILVDCASFDALPKSYMDEDDDFGFYYQRVAYCDAIEAGIRWVCTDRLRRATPKEAADAERWIHHPALHRRAA